MGKTLAGLAVLACAGLLSACSSDDATAGQTARPSAQAPATIEKKVGEEGAWGCESKDNTSCSVAFTVTSITPVPISDCSSSSDVPADSKIYKVAIDVQGHHPTPKPNEHIPPGYIVASDNWYALGSDGYTTKAQVMFGCGDYTPGPFYQHVEVGQKQRGTIIYAVPANSTDLQLRSQGGGAWEWKLPG